MSPYDFTTAQRFVRGFEYGIAEYVEDSRKDVFTLGGIDYYIGIKSTTPRYSAIIDDRETDVTESDISRENKPFEHMVDFMDEAIREDVFPRADRREHISDYLCKFAETTKRLAGGTRNYAAHDRVMGYDDAAACADTVVVVERLLYEFVSKIRPEYLVKPKKHIEVKRA